LEVFARLGHSFIHSFFLSSGVGLKKATKKKRRWSKTQSLGGIKRVIINKNKSDHKLLKLKGV
jgi:hypothetical protein